MSTNSIIWMGDIQPKMTEREIMNCFLKFNIRPQSIKLIKDKKTNENKNYCFIYFKTIKEANSVLFKLNGKKIPGHSFNFRLNWANCRSSFNKSAYVGNLNPKVDDLKLYNLFKKKYPTVQHASVITDNGVSKGYGFVLFNGKEEYEKSLKEMNGINFYGNIIKVKEQKKKENNNKKNESSIDDDEDNDSSYSPNNSEKNNEDQFGNNIKQSNNNKNNFTNNIINSAPLNNISNNTNLNNSKIVININNNINISDLISNSQISSIGINNIKKNIPYANINNNNTSNKIVYKNNVNNNESINIEIGARFLKKSNFSNNSIISLNSVNSEKMSNYSTAEKFNNQKQLKKGNIKISQLNALDENTLHKKINNGIKKMFNHYKKNPFYGDKMIICK